MVIRSKTSYIYAIQNIDTGKLYVGSTKNRRKRWGSHRRHLKKDKHHSKRLQEAWNEYGSDSFVFGVIEGCEVDQLVETEQKWLDHYKSYDPENGYNTADNAESPMAGRTHSEETRRLIGQASKERWQKQPHPMLGTTRSEECRRKISQANMGNPSPMKGKTQTPEAREKMSKAVNSWLENNEPVRLGATHTKKSRQKLSASLKKYYKNNDPWNKGIPLREETKRKLSESLKGRTCTEYAKKRASEVHRGEGNSSAKLTKSNVLQILTLYESDDNSLSQAKLGEVFGVTQAQVYHIVNGKSWQHVYDEFHNKGKRKSICEDLRVKIEKVDARPNNIRKGENHTSSKLTETQVRQILSHHNSEKNSLTQRDLAPATPMSVES